MKIPHFKQNSSTRENSAENYFKVRVRLRLIAEKVSKVSVIMENLELFNKKMFKQREELITEKR